MRLALGAVGTSTMSACRRNRGCPAARGARTTPAERGRRGAPARRRSGHAAHLGPPLRHRAHRAHPRPAPTLLARRHRPARLMQHALVRGASPADAARFATTAPAAGRGSTPRAGRPDELTRPGPQRAAAALRLPGAGRARTGWPAPRCAGSRSGARTCWPRPSPPSASRPTWDDVVRPVLAAIGRALGSTPAPGWRSSTCSASACAAVFGRLRGDRGRRGRRPAGAAGRDARRAAHAAAGRAGRRAGRAAACRAGSSGRTCRSPALVGRRPAHRPVARRAVGAAPRDGRRRGAGVAAPDQAAVPHVRRRPGLGGPRAAAAGSAGWTRWSRRARPSPTWCRSDRRGPSGSDHPAASVSDPTRASPVRTPGANDSNGLVARASAEWRDDRTRRADDAPATLAVSCRSCALRLARMPSDGGVDTAGAAYDANVIRPFGGSVTHMSSATRRKTPEWRPHNGPVRVKVSGSPADAGVTHHPAAGSCRKESS